MVFCGHCGYQLAPGDKVCPRCGAETDIDPAVQEPAAYNPTERSQVVQDVSRSPTSRDGNQPPGRPTPQQPAGPLVLRPSSGPGYDNEEATTVMNSPAYQQPQQVYPNAGYPSMTNMGGYGYNAPGQSQYQGGQSAVVAQLLASSRKGKNGALLLILFGLLLLIAAIVVFLLNQQGIIFPH